MASRLAEGFWEMATHKSDAEQALLFDPQTSGGLLLAVPASQADDLVSGLKNQGVAAAARIGEVVSAGKPFIRVI